MTLDATSIQPFKINIDEKTLDRIRTCVASYPWHEMPNLGGWEYGTNLKYMKELCAYWVEEYDWRKHEAIINRFSHFVAPIDGMDIHFVREKGSGPAPLPLIVSHGWPSSIVELLAVIEPLAHPERFGGNVEDSFDVIVPSLPGFGFSSKPQHPMKPSEIAGLLNKLMTESLGYENYISQGGDWGSVISTWLGYKHAPACRGIHINVLAMRHIDGPQGEDELAWAEQFEIEQVMQNGYRTQQATKPQTLSYAMAGNPVGVAAWIIEKLHSWSDIKDNDIESVYTKDQLLTNVMVYLVTNTFSTASWIYYGRREEGGRIFSPEGKRVEVPTGCALFPAEMLSWPPRSYVDRLYNVTHWTEMSCGGHFAPMEQPDLLVEDIRRFARNLR